MCKNTDKYLHALTRILRFMDQGITKTAHRSFHYISVFLLTMDLDDLWQKGGKQNK